MIRYLLLFFLAPLLLIAAEDKEKPTAKDDGFVPLFDGKTLRGWVPVNVAPDTFYVKDGMLVTTGVPTGFLRTEKRYENFILECEYMHMKPKGNSGIFVWADPLPAVGSPFTRAIEVQVLDGLETPNYTSHGDVFAIWGATFVPDRPHPNGWMRCLPSEKRAKPAGQWNHYRIECKDGTIRLAVNGKVVSGGTKAKPRLGYIALEAEGSECRFRNLRLKELPSTKPTPEESCPEAQGHTTLMNAALRYVRTGGLEDFTLADSPPQNWTFEPSTNELRFASKQEMPRSQLIFPGLPANGEMIMDVQSPKQTKLVVCIGRLVPPRFWGGLGKTPAYVVGTRTEIKQTAATADKWQRYVFTHRQGPGELEVQLHGKTFHKEKASDSSLWIMIEVEGPAVKLTNLFVRPLTEKEAAQKEAK